MANERDDDELSRKSAQSVHEERDRAEGITVVTTKEGGEREREAIAAEGVRGLLTTTTLSVSNTISMNRNIRGIKELLPEFDASENTF